MVLFGVHVGHTCTCNVCLGWVLGVVQCSVHSDERLGVGVELGGLGVELGMFGLLEKKIMNV